MIQRIFHHGFTIIGLLALLYISAQRILGQRLLHNTITVVGCVGVVYFALVAAATSYDLCLRWKHNDWN